MPGFITTETIPSQGGKVKVQLQSRIGLRTFTYIVVIKSTLPKANPDNGQKYEATLKVQITFLIKNDGPPTFSIPLKDVKIKVNEH